MIKNHMIYKNIIKLIMNQTIMKENLYFIYQFLKHVFY